MERQKWLPALLVLLILCGCNAKKEPTPPRVVTQITVTCDSCASLNRRQYYTDEKMQLILEKIREIGLRDTPDADPEALTGRTIRITLTFSDGTQKIYSQKNNRYFREDSGPWKKIDEEQASRLYLAILLTPGDEDGSHIYRPHPIQLPGTGI